MSANSFSGQEVSAGEPSADPEQQQDTLNQEEQPCLPGAAPLLRPALKTSSNLECADIDKIKKTLSWQDFAGRELTIIHEFEPSESEYSEDDHHDHQDGKGCCTIS